MKIIFKEMILKIKKRCASMSTDQKIKTCKIIAAIYYYGIAILVNLIVFAFSYSIAGIIFRPEHRLGSALIYPLLLYVYPFLSALAHYLEFVDKIEDAAYNE